MNVYIEVVFDDPDGKIVVSPMQVVNTSLHLYFEEWDRTQDDMFPMGTSHFEIYMNNRHETPQIETRRENGKLIIRIERELESGVFFEAKDRKRGTINDQYD